jgi:Spy/CpxP family protein refolding chaperone
MFALLVSLSVAALAQNDAQTPGGRGQRGFGGRGGGRLTLAMVPVSALTDELKLTGEQKTQLTTIETKYRSDARTLRPAPGATPDPSVRQKRTEMTQQASQEMEAVLTTEQKAKLPLIMRHFGMLRMVGIPLETYHDLKLTSDQKKQIGDIAQNVQTKMQGLAAEDRRTQGRQIRQDAQTKVMALLTADQKAILTKYEQAHPRGRGFGNRGNNA